MIHLVLGGARSGKSRFAEATIKKTAEESNKRVTYIATASAGDDEMRVRIERHKSQRPNDWRLIEEPLKVAEVIRSCSHNDLLLIDCLTLWLSNWLCEGSLDDFEEAKRSLLASLKSTEAGVVLVSNEVGSGIVPLGELSRDFVDQAGWLNQAIAAMADKVSLIVAGCEVPLQPFEQAKIN
ncbi:bifunctional adenosylcobinamide kinase/adenosylcobinamide-phosphate guanylyltransferase [Aliikangiella sp. G2MR2-5]|uniref:bifunctional adenosylcobinamide kinase/adenosylcobinamide-phosphate guanylyltransferase n=1 Tax=Aliikangiella sp. G2MR2-5 TaxID=2788943 RepID=UPI0018AAC317|nr:bifunctional adenosylcobinamide kinase/adenosylcobinamide-phosphate guanylyltransferase [Aliikangiella sp. G2MR2-5]